MPAVDPRSTITWKRLVREMTAGATVCAVCGYPLRKHDPPRSRWRPSVDHVLPIVDYPRLVYERSNLRVVHIGCNSRLSNQARRGHPERIGGRPWRRQPTARQLPPGDPGPGPGW